MLVIQLPPIQKLACGTLVFKLVAAVLFGNSKVGEKYLVVICSWSIFLRRELYINRTNQIAPKFHIHLFPELDKNGQLFLRDHF